jgi:hypothetical protein
MDADFSIELGHEDAVLDLPWKDPSGKLAYVELKRRPDLLAQIPEAETFPELGKALQTINSPRSIVETAKCDAWATTELNAEEEHYEAPHKFASYMDIVFSAMDARLSFSLHEGFARELVNLLRRVPEAATALEVCVRRCYSQEKEIVREGYYFTLYVYGYGNDGDSARQNWGTGLNLIANAILELSAKRSQ